MVMTTWTSREGGLIILMIIIYEHNYQIGEPRTTRQSCRSPSPHRLRQPPEMRVNKIGDEEMTMILKLLDFG